MENDRLMITLPGRIDTNNAAESEQEILSILAENAGKEIAFDAAWSTSPPPGCGC